MEDSKKARRFIFTINNAFWENQFEEVDIFNTDLKILDDYVNLSFLDTIFNKKYFDFKYIRWEIKGENESEFVCIKRPFFKDDDSVTDYISSLKNFRYTCWQVELGEQEHTQHVTNLVYTNLSYYAHAYTNLDMPLLFPYWKRLV